MESNRVNTPVLRKKVVKYPEKKTENEALKRHLNNVMDERDELKLMLEEIRSQFTAETRLREFLGKMLNTVLKVLSNEKKDANVRIQECLEILSSFHLTSDDTLQTTGEFLTDLSYSDQETIYGCIPTSAQRKKVLQRATQDEPTLKEPPSCSLAIPLPWKCSPPPGSRNPHATNVRRLSKQEDGDTLAKDNQTDASSCFKSADCKGDQTFQFKFKVPVPIKKSRYLKKLLTGESENMVPEHINFEVKKEVSEQKESSFRREEITKEWPRTPISKPLMRNICPKPQDDHTNENTFLVTTPALVATNREVESTKSQTSKQTLEKFSEGGSSKLAFDTEDLPHLTPKTRPKKHRFILSLEKNPDVCGYCKSRVYESQFVRRCNGCGLMVHARKCEFEGQCPASPD